MSHRRDWAGRALEQLLALGLAYPGAHTKSPWPGHQDLAVNGKTFAFLSVSGEQLGVSCKLPRSADAALALPFTAPTGYGLGKSGWVSATFSGGEPVPLDLLAAWIDESYRARAPKRLCAGLAAPGEVTLGSSVAPRASAAARVPRSGAVGTRQAKKKAHTAGREQARKKAARAAAGARRRA